MVAAWTTAAVINHSMNPPEKWTSPLDFMPNYRHRESPEACPTLSREDQQNLMSDYNLRVAELAARLKEKNEFGIRQPTGEAELAQG